MRISELIIILSLWWVVWRPGMVEWWRSRHIDKADREELRSLNTIEDMFK